MGPQGKNVTQGKDRQDTAGELLVRTGDSSTWGNAVVCGFWGWNKACITQQTPCTHLRREVQPDERAGV